MPIFAHFEAVQKPAASGMSVKSSEFLRSVHAAESLATSRSLLYQARGHALRVLGAGEAHFLQGVLDRVEGSAESEP